MKASILSVGTELLFGQVVNTNAAYLSRHLNLMGFDVLYHFAVGDNPDRLKKTLLKAINETELVITTGGLGPTQDDLTKEIVAESLGIPIERNEEAYEFLMRKFKDRQMTPNNLKQADMPVGSKVFINEAGTAPGFAVKKNGKHVISFPGPPIEVYWLFNNGVRDYLSELAGENKNMYYRVVRTIGIGESNLETKLLSIIDNQTDPTIATYAKEGECTIRIASKREKPEDAKSAVEEVISQIEKLVPGCIYSYNDEELNEVVVRKLKDRGLKISAAESCTGGLFAGSLTDVSGASEVFEKSFVTYSEGAKIEEINVSPEAIERFGVVSPEVAVEMAKGVRGLSGCDIAVSITGYAEETEDGNAGIAYIGYSFGKSQGYKEVLTRRNNRKWNRRYFSLMMLKVTNDVLDGVIK